MAETLTFKFCRVKPVPTNSRTNQVRISDAMVTVFRVSPHREMDSHHGSTLIGRSDRAQHCQTHLRSEHGLLRSPVCESLLHDQHDLWTTR